MSTLSTHCPRRTTSLLGPCRAWESGTVHSTRRRGPSGAGSCRVTSAFGHPAWTSLVRGLLQVRRRNCCAGHRGLAGIEDQRGSYGLATCGLCRESPGAHVLRWVQRTSLNEGQPFLISSQREGLRSDFRRARLHGRTVTSWGAATAVTPTGSATGATSRNRQFDGVVVLLLY